MTKKNVPYQVLEEKVECCPKPVGFVVYQPEWQVIPTGTPFTERLAEKNELANQRARASLFGNYPAPAKRMKYVPFVTERKERSQIINFQKDVNVNVFDEKGVPDENAFQTRLRRHQNEMNRKVVNDAVLASVNQGVVDKSRGETQKQDNIANKLRNIISVSGVPVSLAGILLNNMLSHFSNGELLQLSRIRGVLSSHLRRNLGMLNVGDVFGENDLETSILRNQALEMRVKDLAESCVNVLAPVYARSNLLSKGANENPEVSFDSASLYTQYRLGNVLETNDSYLTPEEIVRNGQANGTEMGKEEKGEFYKDGVIHPTLAQIRKGYINRSGISILPYDGPLEGYYEEISKSGRYRVLETVDDVRDVDDEGVGEEKKGEVVSSKVESRDSKLKVSNQRKIARRQAFIDSQVRELEARQKELEAELQALKSQRVPLENREDFVQDYEQMIDELLERRDELGNFDFRSEDEIKKAEEILKTVKDDLEDFEEVQDKLEELVGPLGPSGPPSLERSRSDEPGGSSFEEDKKEGDPETLSVSPIQNLWEVMYRTPVVTGEVKGRRTQFGLLVDKLMVDGFTMDDLAKLAAVEKKLLMYYFELKESDLTEQSRIELLLTKKLPTGGWGVAKQNRLVKYIENTLGGWGLAKPLDKKHKTKLTKKEKLVIRMMGNDSY